jgi:hypothetical protein
MRYLRAAEEKLEALDVSSRSHKLLPPYPSVLVNSASGMGSALPEHQDRPLIIIGPNIGATNTEVGCITPEGQLKFVSLPGQENTSNCFATTFQFTEEAVEALHGTWSY